MIPLTVDGVPANCGACVYSVRKAEWNNALCHRYPKQEPCHEGHWCGEFRPTPQAVSDERGKRAEANKASRRTVCVQADDVVERW